MNPRDPLYVPGVEPVTIEDRPSVSWILVGYVLAALLGIAAGLVLALFLLAFATPSSGQTTDPTVQSGTSSAALSGAPHGRDEDTSPAGGAPLFSGGRARRSAAHDVHLGVAPKSETLAPPVQALKGVATWFAARAGTAAAGPELRALLGPKWRGQTVIVSHGASRVRVRLTDWCLCSHDHRLVDLARADFARLAPPSRGVIAVIVIVGGDLPPPPPTDTAP